MEEIFAIPEGVSLLFAILSLIKKIVSFLGVVIILYGAVRASYYFISNCQKKVRRIDSVDKIRLEFGKTIVLGLEFIVAADVIATTTAPNYYSLGILGGLVAIRTLLTYFLNREINTIVCTGKKS